MHTSVKRFVYGSSSDAAATPTQFPEFLIDSSTWNHKAIRDAWAPPPYEVDRSLAVFAASKAVAEQACWKWVRETPSSFVLNTVLPAPVLGRLTHPSQLATNAGAIHRMRKEDPGAADFMRSFAPHHYINVRDSALIHLAALIYDDIRDERVLACAAPFSYDDVVLELEKQDSVPRHLERWQDCPLDLNTFDSARGLELLKRMGVDGWTSWEQTIREACLSE